MSLGKEEPPSVATRWQTTLLMHVISLSPLTAGAKTSQKTPASYIPFVMLLIKVAIPPPENGGASGVIKAILTG